MNSSAQRVGFWATLGIFWIDVVYVGTGLAWVFFGSRNGGARFHPEGFYLAILEGLIVVIAPLMIVMMAAVHRAAASEDKTHTLAALCTMTLAAGITASIHFVRLAAVKRLEPAVAAGLSPLLSFEWPSVAFALDLLAWDLLFGLSLLLAARAFHGPGLAGAVRTTFAVAGALCVAGTLGPATGNLRLQLPAIAGYAFVFPVACLLLGILFGRGDGATGRLS
jgi:hypothetical protein